MSHNNFGAFFSGQDLKDEAGSRLFGVIGKVGTEQPEMVIRAASNRQEIALKIEDAFDVDLLKLKEDSDYTISAQAMENVVENRVTYPLTTKTSTQPYTNQYTAGRGTNAYNGYNYGYDDDWPTSTQQNVTPYQKKVKLKNKLIAELGYFSNHSYLSHVNLKAIWELFLEYIELETDNKTMYISSATLEKCVEELSFQTEMVLSNIVEGFKDPKDVEDFDTLAEAEIPLIETNLEAKPITNVETAIEETLETPEFKDPI